MSESEFISFIERAQWQLAKTMPHVPHEYTLKKNNDSSKFIQACIFIRERGVTEKFGGRDYVYFYHEGKKYWTMGAPLDITILINRATA